MTERIPKGKKIILFDGVCNLCNNAVNFIIERDKKDIFLFASLQSEIGQQLTAERGIDVEEAMNSFLLIEPGVAYYQRSTAALEVSKDLSGGYSFLSYFSVLPEGFRDSIYNLVAKNRYKWFGKKDNCMIPTPELKAKFLD
ncbi:thiol-disulfide oxidoreductase DCC family protein [Antarcticibacterium flavum]|uniref:Thiol-disulfide oxidoreductase DCC family protein n=1 Tax=Antarcticibacterium flavum TaxID=2058175 RepID=A0A5B7WY67_9FLAO|nr:MULTISPECIES: thiol-disulfide oxidoreductase DCC family protein [Antarcticibacterium]MCM4158857.1 thiol-disulfide oxidoreductase [Antarcticibacterium sp. W02-3]QCY68116.1 thiol-disulfide oxidoreductase DCC family protein [Antarcticibacterium flavum]